MPKITPIPTDKLRKVFEKAGFECVRIEGDQFVYVNEGVPRGGDVRISFIHLVPEAGGILFPSSDLGLGAFSHLLTYLVKKLGSEISAIRPFNCTRVGINPDFFEKLNFI